MVWVKGRVGLGNVKGLLLQRLRRAESWQGILATFLRERPAAPRRGWSDPEMSLKPRRQILVWLALAALARPMLAPETTFRLLSDRKSHNDAEK